MTVTDQPAAGRFIGAAVERREDARLLTGRGRYVDDVTVAGMLHAAFVRSSLPRGQITARDASEARTFPGVRAVLFADDLAAVAGEAVPRSLSSRFVRYVGEPIAVVIATSRAIAEDAAELVRVDIDPIEPVLDVTRAVDDPAACAGPDQNSVVVGPRGELTEELEGAFRDAAHVVTETLVQHRYIPVPMETRGVLAHWDQVDQRLTAWISTQGAHGARDHFARTLGMETHRVRVIVGDVGGGFGLKISVGAEETAVVLAARLVGKPVKWIEDRYENLLSGHHARADRATVSFAFDGDARLVGIKADHIEDVGAYGGGGGMGIIRLVPGPYRVRHVGGRAWSVRTNTMTRGPYRGPWMFETVVRETVMDIAARRIGIDPLELRRRNVITKDELPYPGGMGPYENITPAETLEQAAELIGYDEFRKEQALAREQGRYVGIGVAGYVEPSAMGFGGSATDAVTLRIDPTGKVHLITGVNSQGHSVETTMAQVVADHLGVHIDDIVFSNGDTDLVPVGATTGGSRNAVFGGGAARQAAIAMRERVFAIAAHTMEIAPEDLEIADSVIRVRGTPTKSQALAEIAKLAYGSPASLPPGIDAGLEIASRFTTSGVTWSNATHACTCEVDIETGLVQLLRYVVSEDCGTIINPLVVEGQIAGGVVQGIGGVLYEHFVYDDDGNPLTSTFMDYLLPTATEVPMLEYGHIETPSSKPGGFKGMGEGGAIGAPAAVFNAVADALAPLGVTLTRQPLSPAAIVEAVVAATS